jgi:hypothetical protein
LCSASKVLLPLDFREHVLDGGGPHEGPTIAEQERSRSTSIRKILNATRSQGSRLRIRLRDAPPLLARAQAARAFGAGRDPLPSAPCAGLGVGGGVRDNRPADAMASGEDNAAAAFELKVLPVLFSSGLARLRLHVTFGFAHRDLVAQPTRPLRMAHSNRYCGRNQWM